MWTLVLVLVTLVVLAVVSGRFGAESRDGFDPSAARARGSGR
jgi:hypothetical protein